jgi:ferredoxin--NADP+ reductase
MYQITEAKFLSPNTKLFRILAPRIAKKRKAGQFIILRVDEHGERIPITISDANPEDGTITIIVQAIGKTTKKMAELEAGDSILDVAGPLGRESEIEKYGTVVVIGGGLGAAIAYPTARAMKEAGNYVISIIGARSKEYVILEDEIRSISDELLITTDDGSYCEKGFVTNKLQTLIDNGVKIDYVLAIGPIPMMSAVAEVTRPHAIKTVVSLNAIMVDGTGMCGGCRVSIAGKAQFACVDGPEFDAHLVDFPLMRQRTSMYASMEREALKRFEESDDHICRLTGESREKLAGTPGV